MTTTTNTAINAVEVALTAALTPSVALYATSQLTAGQLNTMAANMVGIAPCTHAQVATGQVIAMDAYFAAYIAKQLSNEELSNALISTYLFIQQGMATVVDASKVNQSMVVTADNAVNTNTQNTNNGGVQMNTQTTQQQVVGFTCREDIVATFNAGNMTATEYIQAIDLFNVQQAQAQAQQPVQQIGNAVGTMATGVSQIATGAVTGISQILGAFTGTATQVGQQLGGSDLMGKAKQGADTVIDKSHAAVTVGINTTGALAKQGVVLGTDVGSQVITTASTIADSLLKASGEIANTLIDGAMGGAHVVNNGLYKVGKSITGGELSPEAQALLDEFNF